MFQAFRRMPEPLQKQILIRLGLGAVFLIFIPVLIIAVHDPYLWLPCAGITVFFVVTAFFLFRRVILNEYVVVIGECTEFGVTAVKRRVKYLLIQTDECKVKVMLRNRQQKIPVGAVIRLYISKNTPIYEQNNVQILYTYMAIDVK